MRRAISNRLYYTRPRPCRVIVEAPIRWTSLPIRTSISVPGEILFYPTRKYGGASRGSNSCSPPEPQSHEPQTVIHGDILELKEEQGHTNNLHTIASDNENYRATVGSNQLELINNTLDGEISPLSRRAYHRNSNEKVAVDARRLGIKTLGRPAEAIVIRGLRPRIGGYKKDTITTSIHSAPDLWQLVEKLGGRGGAATLEEAQSNIEGLRPKHAVTLSHREFKALADILFEGFTMAQLQHYTVARPGHNIAQSGKSNSQSEPNPDVSTTHSSVFNKYQTSTHNRLPESDMPARYPWITHETPWAPLKEYDFSLGTPKEKAVQTIMQDCWNLQVQELMDGGGRMDVRTGSRILKLLLRGHKAILHELAERLLDEGDSIEISKYQRRISILSTKAKAETILSDIDKVVSRMRIRTLDAAVILNSDMTADELELLGQITETVVNHDAPSGKIQIAWIQREPIKEHLETPDQVVIRLLSTTADSDVNFSNDLIIASRYEHQSSLGHGHFASDPRIDQNLAIGWRDSIANWSRWVLPSDRIKEPTSGPSIPRNHHRVHDRLSSMCKRILPLSTHGMESIPSSGWLQPDVVATATFGHILHSARNNTSLPPPPILLLGKHHRIISPIVPPPSVFASFGLSLSSVPVYTSILFRFRPSPDNINHNGSIKSSSLPTLELVINIADGQTLSSKLSWRECEKRLFGIISTHNSDIMLPAGHVDVRVNQVLRMECSPDMLSSAAMDNLGLFVDVSDLNLKKGHIATPSEVVIPIPNALLTLSSSSSHSQSFSVITRNSRDTEIENVKYVFRGLELRQTINAKCSGHILQYSSTEAGRRGGRWVGLSLIAGDLPTDATQQATTLSNRNYLNTVQSIANGAIFPWFQTVST